MPPTKKRPQDLNIRFSHDKTKLQKYWNHQLEELDDNSHTPTHGRVRTKHECFLILMTIKLLLKTYIDTDDYGTIKSINWTKLENEVATGLKVRDKTVRKIRQQYFVDGDYIFNPRDNEIDNNNGNEDEDEANEVRARKLNNEQLQSMILEVDKRHDEGKAVTQQLLKNFIMQKYKIDVSKTTIGKYFKILGLSYKPIKNKRRNIGAYRPDMLRDFIINMDEKYKVMIKDEENCPFVFVFTDESYVHRRCGLTKSYFGKDSKDFNRSTSKGDRLIIMHAITVKGPLTDYDDINQPADRLVWTLDTPRPYPHKDGLLTCETIWKATTKTGDYHQNMSSEMLMKWVIECLIPTFERNHEGKQMVLVMDNAAYHHKRHIDSISSKTKEELVVMAGNMFCTHINIPVTEHRHNCLIAAEDSIEDIMNYDGLTCDVKFNSTRFMMTASRNNPFIPNVDELRRGLFKYILEYEPGLLVCEVETELRKHGHIIIWTPPYTPELQPIELFWAAGKNHVRYRNSSDTTNKQVVEYLREGWFGNEHLFEDEDDNQPKPYDLLRKAPVDCRKLFETCIGLANTKYIGMCEGLSGVMGDLRITPGHVRVTDGIPVDWMMNGLIDDTDIGADIGDNDDGNGNN